MVAWIICSTRVHFHFHYKVFLPNTLPLSFIKLIQAQFKRCNQRISDRNKLKIMITIVYLIETEFFITVMLVIYSYIEKVPSNRHHSILLTGKEVRVWEGPQLGDAAPLTSAYEWKRDNSNESAPRTHLLVVELNSSSHSVSNKCYLWLHKKLYAITN